MKKIYTEEQKCTILQRYWSGEFVSSISADTGVAKSTLYKWIREAPPKKAKPVMEAFFKTLKAEELYRNNYRSERVFKSRTNFEVFPKSQFD